MSFFRVLCIWMFLASAALGPGLRADPLRAIDVIIDQAKLVRLDADTSQIIVGNPAIADVTAQSARLLVITGKSYGTTNLIALDKTGAEIFTTTLAVHEGLNRKVTLYNGTVRRSYHCAPDCQRTLSIGDDRSQFDDLAQSVERKFGVVSSAIGDVK